MLWKCSVEKEFQASDSFGGIISVAALSLVCLAIIIGPLAFSSQISGYADSPKRTVFQLASIGAFILALLDSLRKPRQNYNTSGSIPALLFFAILTLGLFRGDFTFHAVEFWIHLSCSIILYFSTTWLIGSKPCAAQRILQAIAISSIAAVGIGYLELYNVSNIMPGASHETASTFGNKNWFAQYLILTIPALWFLLKTEKSRLFQYSAAIATGLILSLLLEINSSSAYLSISAIIITAIATAIFCHKRDWHRFILPSGKPLIIILVITAVTSLHSPSGWKNPFDGLIGEIVTTKDAFNPGPASASKASNNARTVRDRLDTYQVTLGMIVDQPWLGQGLGNFRRDFLKFNERTGHPVRLTIHRTQGHAHNDWLQLLSELGLFILPLIAYFGFGIVRNFWHQFQTTGPEFHSDRKEYVALAAICALVGIGVFAFFSYPLHNAVPPMLIALYCALLRPQKEGTAICLSHKMHRIIGSLFLLFAIAAFFLNAHRRHNVYQYEYELARITGALNQQDWESVLKRSLTAEHYLRNRDSHLPYKGQALIALGQHSEAAHVVERLIVGGETAPLGHAFQATIFMNRGDHRSALAQAQIAHELLPHDPNLKALLADLQNQD